MGTVKWTGIPLNSRYFPKLRWRLEEGFFSLPPYPLSPTPFDACYAGYKNKVAALEIHPRQSRL